MKQDVLEFRWSRRIVHCGRICPHLGYPIGAEISHVKLIEFASNNLEDKCIGGLKFWLFTYNYSPRGILLSSFATMVEESSRNVVILNADVIIEENRESAIWCSWLMLQAKVFIWRVMVGALPMRNTLNKRKVSSGMCFFCLAKLEHSKQWFVSCIMCRIFWKAYIFSLWLE